MSTLESRLRACPKRRTERDDFRYLPREKGKIIKVREAMRAGLSPCAAAKFLGFNRHYVRGAYVREKAKSESHLPPDLSLDRAIEARRRAGEAVLACLSVETQTLIQHAAMERGLTPGVVAVLLVETVAMDGLFAAVFDDAAVAANDSEHERKGRAVA